MLYIVLENIKEGVYGSMRLCKKIEEKCIGCAYASPIIVIITIIVAVVLVY